QAAQTLAATFNRATTQLRAGRDGLPCRPSLSARPAVAPYQSVPVGKLSSLQEDENRYYATAVIEKGENSLRLATVSWVKKPLGSWVAGAEDQLPATMAATGVSYTLP